MKCLLDPQLRRIQRLDQREFVCECLAPTVINDPSQENRRGRSRPRRWGDFTLASSSSSTRRGNASSLLPHREKARMRVGFKLRIYPAVKVTQTDTQIPAR